jgi:hypothetical protein
MTLGVSPDFEALLDSIASPNEPSSGKSGAMR